MTNEDAMCVYPPNSEGHARSCSTQLESHGALPYLRSDLPLKEVPKPKYPKLKARMMRGDLGWDEEEYQAMMERVKGFNDAHAKLRGTPSLFDPLKLRTPVPMAIPDSRYEEPAYVKARAEVIIQRLNERGHIPPIYFGPETLYYREKLRNGMKWDDPESETPWSTTEETSPEVVQSYSQLKEPSPVDVAAASQPTQMREKTSHPPQKSSSMKPPRRYDLRSVQTKSKVIKGRVTKKGSIEHTHAMVTRSRCKDNSMHRSVTSKRKSKRKAAN